MMLSMASVSQVCPLKLLCVMRDCISNGGDFHLMNTQGLLIDYSEVLVWPALTV